ncbi:(R)-stereoselective amidase (plasmid) [Sulfitobacter sp. THAF37]|uniref:carbon-nitrogen hydrolase family protein n=1 Tax=Sulfitobacter sp. THAF37 TaxID=2587855 RepID=UPI001269477B|nr:carbon-nitrogen hydrolase family protein [Sulfitobacter sp. THAF37]QFT60802.1 (R)-stereoselective amidase [Sulfitobacter sp. THAF37]
MKIACMQVPPIRTDPPRALDRLARAARDARALGCDLLITPEMYLTGYNIGAGAVSQLAQPRDGALARAVADLARQTGLAILFGFPERDRDRLYNAAQLVDAGGAALCTYRKTHLFGDVDATQFHPGPARSPVVTLNGWRVALAICYDIEFPELARASARDGAEALLVPTANMAPYLSVPNRLVPARAEENGIFVAYANYIGREDGFDYCGLSCICDPSGADLARAGTGEGLIAASLDRARIAQVRQGVNYLADRRPDVYLPAPEDD